MQRKFPFPVGETLLKRCEMGGTGLLDSSEMLDEDIEKRIVLGQIEHVGNH